MLVKLVHRQTNASVHLVGVHHRSTKSIALVKRAIADIDPHYCALELDDDRAELLAAGLYPTEIGREMKAALDMAKNAIQRNIDANTSPSWIGSMIYKGLIYAMFRRDIEYDIAMDKYQASYLQLWRHFYPEQYYNWIELRNANMVFNLRHIVKSVHDLSCINPSQAQRNGDLKIVAIVGKGHLFGMVELWERFVKDEAFKHVACPYPDDAQFAASFEKTLMDRVYYASQ